MGGTGGCNSLLSNDVVPVPSGPPRKVEVEAVNSSAVKVSWRSPVPNKQHGQIRGYQVHYVRMENGEPKGQPLLKDIMLADAQVIGTLHSSLGQSGKHFIYQTAVQNCLLLLRVPVYQLAFLSVFKKLFFQSNCI